MESDFIKGFCVSIIYMDEQNIYNILEGRLNPKESEKNMYGEVFTPLTLVNSMLDTLLFLH